MSETEFFYWLQGYFELRGEADTSPLTSEQAACIVRHADLVRASSHPDHKATTDFTTIAGILHAVALTGDESGKITAAVRDRLARVFEHVIDPKAGGPEQQAHLNTLHHGSTRPPGPVMRC